MRTTGIGCNWEVRYEIETLDGEDHSPAAAVAAEAAPYGRPPAGG